MKPRIKFYILVLLIGIAGCKSKEKISADENLSPPDYYTEADTNYAEVYDPYFSTPDYEHATVFKGTYDQDFDLIHTKLAVEFDWTNELVFGKINIWCKPHFLPGNKVVIDAKKMDIKGIELVDKKQMLPLSYTYDSLKLVVNLDKMYTRNDTVNIQIVYTAYPSRFTDTFGGGAVTDDNGLYFINPKGKSGDHMPQIWTQNEPEYASVWFPTFDSPAQRHTQELEITVDSKYLTLSNGKLVKQQKNANGTRTDYWQQNKTHPPYLTMLAVGEFAKIDDKAGNLPLSYYVEKQYAAEAKALFGATPRMIALLSKLFGVKYPWDKYDQIVVRNFVSGAMENTTATVFGDFVYAYKNEYVDANQEEIIVHELSHHWFGDLVTCENWANLVLNEGFASYAENLWYEYEYDVYTAQYHRFNDLQDYLNEASYQPKKVLRHAYGSPNDMFDAHSYQKGSILLYQLRRLVGDEVFFESIKRYLTQYQFKSAELSDLRKIFEEVSGKDLVWYFEQWYEREEYPEVYTEWNYDPETNTVMMNVTQEMSMTDRPVFYLPLDVAIYEGGQMRIEKVILDSRSESFEFKCSKKPDLVLLDPDYTLVGKLTRNLTEDESKYMLENVLHVQAQMEAIDGLSLITHQADVQKLFFKALKHPFWFVRSRAIDVLYSVMDTSNVSFTEQLVNMAKHDANSMVRQNTLSYLRYQTAGRNADLYTYILDNDSSAGMLNTALNILAEIDIQKAMQYAVKYESNPSLLSGVAQVYASNGNAGQGEFFIKALKASNYYAQFTIFSYFEQYLLKQKPEVAEPLTEKLLILHAQQNNEMWDQMVLTLVYNLLLSWETIAQSPNYYESTSLSPEQLRQKIDHLNKVFSSLRN